MGWHQVGTAEGSYLASASEGRSPVFQEWWRRVTALFSSSREFCVLWDREPWSLLLGTSLLCCCLGAQGRAASLSAASGILHLPGTQSPLGGLLVTEYRAGVSETTCQSSLTSVCSLPSLSHLQTTPVP